MKLLIVYFLFFLSKIGVKNMKIKFSGTIPKNNSFSKKKLENKMKIISNGTNLQ